MVLLFWQTDVTCHALEALGVQSELIQGKEELGIKTDLILTRHALLPKQPYASAQLLFNVITGQHASSSARFAMNQNHYHPLSILSVTVVS
jgi:hypothetical protein